MDGKKKAGLLKVKERVEIIDITSISLSRGGGKSAFGLDVMLRTSAKNRLRKFLMSTDEVRLQMCWAVRQAFRVQSQKQIKVFDENGDEFSKRLDEMCLQYEWDENMHPILVPDFDADSNDEMAGNFERNVSPFFSPYQP